ncbi:MAG TPA: AmmeMemoRadiSam system protein A [Clostridia bacterium]|nr:AmmeMemoRadiSam system protein A [Clostridia bacterium]
MGSILGAYLFPHPPIILEEIGRGEEKKAKGTIEGSKILSQDIKGKSPSTIIVITPHGPLYKDAIAISVEEDLKGDFSRFGHGRLKFQYKNNVGLTNKIIENSFKEGIPIAEVDVELDHGVLVPLYFVDKEYSHYKLIHITYGLLSPEILYRFGRIIEKSLVESDEDVVIIASGDLSHRLSDDGPYSYSDRGKEFDEKIVEVIKEGNMKAIISFDLELAEEAGECGLRSLMIMAGAIDSYDLKPEVLSYEGPFGVGYSTARIDIAGETSIDQEELDYVKLARQSLEHYIIHGEHMPSPEKLKGIEKGVFVTLKQNGSLRGCIGTIQPTQPSVELEIIRNAVLAGTEDYRFDRVREEDLEELVYSVDVLSEPEPIETMEELDIKRYGVIVSKGPRRGLLLPNLEGVNSIEEQVSISLSKAGIHPDEEYKMERFEVSRHY